MEEATIKCQRLISICEEDDTNLKALQQLFHLRKVNTWLASVVPCPDALQSRLRAFAAEKHRLYMQKRKAAMTPEQLEEFRLRDKQRQKNKRDAAKAQWQADISQMTAARTLLDIVQNDQSTGTVAMGESSMIGDENAEMPASDCNRTADTGFVERKRCRTIIDIETKLRQEQCISSVDLLPNPGGDRENQLHVIKPPVSEEAAEPLRILTALGKTIETMLPDFITIMESSTETARGLVVINGDRYMASIPDELSLLDESSGRFEAIKLVFAKMSASGGEWSIADIWESVISYCIRQAHGDLLHREGAPATGYAFSTFSIIISYGQLKRQSIHIDMPLPNYQCSVMLTPGHLGTHEYSSRDGSKIESAEDLFRVYWHDAPPGLLECIASSEVCQRFIGRFGGVLADNLVQHSQPSPRLIKVGTTFTMPGSLVHAGPSSSRFRAIIFCSAVSTNQLNKRYNPDEQFNKATLLATIGYEVLLDLNKPCTKYFLQKFNEALLKEKHSHGVVQHVDLRNYADNLLSVATVANQKNLCEYFQLQLGLQRKRRKATGDVKWWSAIHQD